MSIGNPYKRKTLTDDVGSNSRRSRWLKNGSQQIINQDNTNKGFYGPYEYVRLRKHIKPDKDSSENRRSSTEDEPFYNTDNIQTKNSVALTKKIPEKYNIGVIPSNSFQNTNNRPLNGVWSPITHWTLREYHPYSFSYHHHNAKFISERKL